MPQMETAYRMQKAVYWAADGVDDFGEPRVVSNPVQLDVRWVNKRAKAMDAQGNMVALDATAVVDRAIDPGSKMWLGELADWYGTGSGSGETDNDSELMEVATYDETVDLKGRNVRRMVGLVKYKHDLPEQT